MRKLIGLLALQAILAGAAMADVTLLASVNPAVYGASVTLIANVTPASATGSVTFFAGSTILGTGTLTSGQSALSTTLLPAGTNALRAWYSGDANNPARLSASLRETVQAVSGGGFAPPVNYAAGSQPISVAVGDFNGDGFADVAVVNLGDANVSILLGNGDGTFQPAANYQAGAYPQSVATGDFNGDGKVDLAVASLDANNGGQVTVLLGNGNGSFQAPVFYPVGGYAPAVAVSDFNTDGKADLVVVHYASTLPGQAAILLGNGDGTFQTAVNYSVGRGPGAVVAGDFNGDGNADLAVGSIDSTVAVLLGKGDGTFQPAQNIAAGSAPRSLAAGDFNGDGKLDLAADDTGDVSVLLGNGDGTFQPPVYYAAGVTPLSLAVGDFNGDGKTDLAVANLENAASLQSVTVLYGRGDGTFQPAINFAGGDAPYFLAVADFNGDGRADIVTSNRNGGNVSVLLGLPAAPELAIALIHTGFFTPGQSGVTYTITVSNAGSASTSGTVTVTDILPNGLTATAMGGTGWACVLSSLVCTRSDALAPSAAYPPITVTVNVASNPPASLTNTASVTGGGETSTINAVASDIALTSFPTPVINRVGNGVVSGPVLAPGSVAYISGSSLAATTVSVSSPPWPATLANVTVKVNGVAAPLESVSSTQIYFQVPYETAPGTATITVTDGNASSAPYPLVPVSAVMPALLPGPVLNADYSFDSAANPASPGTAVIVYFIGAGITNPPVADGMGAPASPVSVPVAPTSATVGGVSATVSVILTPGTVGLAQASITIPAGLTAGSYPVVITMAGQPSGAATVFVSGSAPVVSSVKPKYALAGSADTTVRILGANFGGGSTVSFQAPGGQTATISPSLIQAAQIDATIPAAYMTTAGTAQVVVSDGLGVASHSAPFYVAPFAISTVTPNRVSPGSAAQVVTVAGQNLSSATSLSFTPPGGTATSIPLSLVQAAQAAATVPAALLTSAGTAQIALANGAGAFSNPLSFAIGAPLQSTTISLTTAANPLGYGQSVTLTASVSPSTATGSVTFYSGVSVLGIAPLAGGQATLKTTLIPSGSSALLARYSGDSTFGPGASALVKQVVNPSAANDFRPAVSYSTGASNNNSKINSMVLADFNGDGKADLAAAGNGGVTIMLGNGDGTFQPATTYPGGALSVAAADFNQDGSIDLATNNFSGAISIFFGNGDGTFQPPVNYPVTSGEPSSSLVASDFNGDGKADLGLQGVLGAVYILLGNGDGTFQPSAAFPTNAVPLSPIAIGDFNGDGAADIASCGSSSQVPIPQVTILLGNGDGTFAAATSYMAGGSSCGGLVVADFNVDGRADIAVSDQDPPFSDDSVGVLLGNGDGTFRSPVISSLPSPAFLLTSVDLNGDGIPDLAAAGSRLMVALGKGDGTFQPAAVYQPNYPLSPLYTDYPWAVLAGDLNGDGRADLTVGSAYGYSVSALLGTVGPAEPQTIDLSPLTNLAQGNVGLQPSSTASTAPITATSGLPVTLSSNTPSVCTVTAVTGTAPETVVTALSSGGCSITATQAGSSAFPNVLPATPVTQSFTVPFSDVSSTAYYYNAINLLAQYGITAGCGANNFCPDQSVTRAQMAIFIVRSIFGSNNFTYSSTPHFTDVQPTDFGFPWIQAMYELGISAGCGNGNYCPNDPVRRDSMAVFLIVARLGAGASFTYPTSPYFTDVLPSDPTFKFVQRLRLEGITGGCTNTTFCPAAAVTRGQMAVFIMAGLFNQLLPSTTPVITSISPATLAVGASGTFTITGANTNFAQGTTTLSPMPGVTIGTIKVNSATSLSVDLTAVTNASAQPRSIIAITGTEQAVLPNALIIH
jgi:uncharacterized protein (TIGR03437 family)